MTLGLNMPVYSLCCSTHGAHHVSQRSETLTDIATVTEGLKQTRQNHEGQLDEYFNNRQIFTFIFYFSCVTVL